VDIAKETADIILLKKDLMVLEEGVIEGRRTFGNIVKYIKMAASGNFGNMISVMGASIFLPFLLAGYCVSTQIMKRLYVRRYGEWL
jgi:Mg2+-importing ATPase